MRDIKFRAYLKDEKKVVDVISVNMLVGFITYYDDLAKEDLMVESPNYVLIQNTGLKDITGKEIYEGDIINICDHITYVLFEYGSFRLKDTAWGGVVSYKIIGNIYENPDLLKTK